jgi:hypothetical protein
MATPTALSLRSTFERNNVVMQSSLSSAPAVGDAIFFAERFSHARTDSQ